MQADKENLTLKEGAEFCGVSPHTFRYWHKQGRFPAIRYSRRVIRFERSVLQAFIAKHRREDSTS